MRFVSQILRHKLNISYFFLVKLAESEAHTVHKRLGEIFHTAQGVVDAQSGASGLDSHVLTFIIITYRELCCI